jgi:putative transposase
MDLYSRKIISRSFSDSLTVELVTEAMQMVIDARGVSPGLIVHSDRGTQYCANDSVGFLERQSISRKGNCWDNAVMESFYARLKVELIYVKNYQSIEEARSGIFGYIEIFYNRKRRHSANDGVSPVAFEEKAAISA